VGRKPSSNLMSRRTEMPYKVDGTGKLAQHSKARCSVPEIDGAVAQGKFTFLLREICAPGTVAQPSGAANREVRRVSTEVSRGHSSGRNEPGHTPEGLTPREGLNWSARVSTPSPLNAVSRPVGRAATGAADGKHGSPSDDPPGSFCMTAGGEPLAVHPTGTAGRGPACPVVWGAGGQSSRLPDCAPDMGVN